MKQTTLTQRLAAALVALCMVLSVCAPALAAEPDGDWTSENDKNSKTFTFKMPEGDVSLRAEYRETYRIFETAGKAEFFAEGAEEQKIHEALPGTRIIAKVPDSELNDYRQFNMWRLFSEKELVEPDQNWQGKQSFRFTMPEGDVELQAFFTTLYDVNVTHGTIVDGTGDTGTSKKIVKPGQPVTVRAESTEENPFLQWTYTGTAPVEPDDGWPEGDWQTSPEFTFKMPNGNVTLEAQRDQLYKVSINDSLGSVTINGEPRSSLWVKGGETVTVATTLKDGYWMEFMKWTAQDGRPRRWSRLITGRPAQPLPLKCPMARWNWSLSGRPARLTRISPSTRTNLLMKTSAWNLIPQAVPLPPWPWAVQPSGAATRSPPA